MQKYHIVLKKECWPNPHTRAALVEDFQLLYGFRPTPGTEHRSVMYGILTGELSEDAAVKVGADNRVLGVDSDSVRFTKS